MLFDLHSDCPRCRVQSALAETWDPEAPCYRLGLPVVTRCRMCGCASDGVMSKEGNFPGDLGCPCCGAALDDAARDAHACPSCGASATLREAAAPRSLGSAVLVESALDAWAREEGLPRAQDLVASAFVLASAAEIHAAIARNEIVETTLDVADFLFSQSSGGGAQGTAAPPIEADEAPPVTQRLIPASIRRLGGPRDELLALASVAASDGETTLFDQEHLERAADKRQVPRLTPEEVRVWRPFEVAPPPTLVDRERLLAEMVELAFNDAQFDESEAAVIRGFARAWGIDPARLDEEMHARTFGVMTPIERWRHKMAAYLFPEG